MEQRLKFGLTLILGILIIGGLFFATSKISSITGNSTKETNETNANVSLDLLAKCLTDKGVKMYGTYWCDNCANQKAMFSSSFQYVTYVECDAGGQNAKPEECQAAGISGYPTWIINEKQYAGEQSITKLKELSGC